MLSSPRPSFVSLRHVISVALSYVLLVTLSVPLTRSAAKAAAAPAPPSANQSGEFGAHRSGELLVRFRPEVSEGEKDAIAATRGARRGRRLRGGSRFERLELTGGQTPQRLAQQLADQPSVEWVEPNYLIGRTDRTPNDARFGEQWALGSENGQPGADIAAPRAWERTTGSTETVIAVIDSGVDFSHPDLTGNQWTNREERANDRDDDRDGYTDDLNGWDWVAGSNQIRDEQGHGTSVAGIIAAEGNNAIGTTGVMWRAGLMSLRVLDNTGTGDVADAVEAIDYAVAHGAQVINLSWGLEIQSQALRDAIERASFRGVLVVCSAGNNGRNLDNVPYYPASYDLSNIISVAATESGDNLTSWSNWGATRVTIAAPGVDLLTTGMGHDYRLVTGTSAAAPVVSGIAGLVKTSYPRLSAADTRAAIVKGARQVAGLGGKVLAGGIAQADGALTAAGSMGNGTAPGGGSSNGNGNGGNGGSENGNGGNGQGQGQRPAPPRPGSDGRGTGGNFNVTPPKVNRSAPPNLPNLDEARKLKNTNPKAPQPSSNITANLMCADCDPEGGSGGGGYVPPGDPRYSKARTERRNETGQAGVDLGSRNFNWSTPLVGLKGRAGLDFGLGLSYNSLVWTKQDYGIKFNADRGFPGPGFRLGFPSIQQRYYNSETGVYSYMMVTPSGGRAELRQVGASNVYEAQDGSYTQMIDNGNGTALVRTTDGTQLSFGTINGEMRCSQIKDRNGNYITVNYDGNGHVDWVVDTLGRVIDFNYDGNHNLSSITQQWNGATHTWATFTYGSLYLQASFPGISVNGPNNSYITVLTQVGLHDGSYYNFNYTSWGQVWQIEKYAADNHRRAYTAYNLPGSPLLVSTAQSDCPRFTERRDWAEEWNGGAEAVTSYSVAGDNSSSQMTTPDGTVYKEFFATTGWQTGLITLSEVWAGGAKKKWTTTEWTQDDPNAIYPINPRPYEINVHDPNGNRRRTTISYTSYSLPSEVREWGGPNADQVLRRTVKNYSWDTPFLNRRIIGLPSSDLVYEGESVLMSKLEYHYDWPNNFSAQVPSVQHDAAGYGATFDYGRGALVGVRRYNVNAPDDPNQAVWPQVYGYDRAGSVIWSDDGSGHRTSIGYSDNYSNSGHNALNTRAYPTTVTDPDGFSSYLQYHYDLGAVTRSQGPPPAGQTQGVIQTMQYDAAGRVERVTTENNGAYTRWVYPAAQNYVQSFSTIINLQSETYAITYVDGGGRPRASAQGHPGSVGGYTATLTGYDVMGRVVQQTKPTEVYASWAPAGDDAAGWVSTYQQYDWKGRPTLTTLPTGNTVAASYEGCGCAGGEVVTTRDERERRRKFYKDALGRLKQVLELNWDQTLYADTTYYYNARDQLVNINQAGQWRGFGYDGHGRLNSRTTPEQGTTTYTYFPDDMTKTVTDARSVTATYSYNNRNLMTGINYTLPANTNVTATNNVSFAYDAAGNRTEMAERDATNTVVGSTAYAYDVLSRLQSETRYFSGVGSFTLSYQYNLGGELTRVTNPWGAQVAYAYDAQGRASDVRGTDAGGTPTYGGVANYATGLQYSAFGGLKGMNYGNGRTLSLGYDNRMRLTSWNVSGVLGWNYAYNNFGENSHRVTYAQNLSDNTLSRSYEYDHLGRLQYSHTGVEARMHVTGQPNDGGGYGPYAQHTYYDVWGNITRRLGWGGGYGDYVDQSYAYGNNNRRTDLGYDPAGNLTSDGAQNYAYDATGQQTFASLTNLTQGYDGNGLRVKKVENGVTTYSLRSSVLGSRVVAELQYWNGSWGWTRGYVYLGGQLLAIQSGGVNWVHQDPVTKSQRLTDASGTVTPTQIDLDPWGGETARSLNTGAQPQRYTTYTRDQNGGDEAMMRRYSGTQQRFSQPDPYDGSYNVMDPQSLNRYAYVQNDPVNFVDPTGLDGEDTFTCLPGDNRCSLGGSVTVTADSGWDYIFNDVGGLFSLLLGSISNRIIQPMPITGGDSTVGVGIVIEPQTTGQPERLPFNSCAEFVDFLVNAAVAASKEVLYDSSKAQFLGGRMMSLAFNDYGRHISNGFSGFKENLISGGQGAGVYGHILGQGGAKLVGWQGMIVGGLADAYDHAQKLAGTQQGAAEVAGNKAGWAVGNHIWNFLSGKTPRESNRLANSLRSELCQ